MSNKTDPVRLQIKSTESDAKKLQLKAVVSAQVLDRDNELVDLNDVTFKNVDGKLAIPILLDHERYSTIKATVGGVKEAGIENGELVFTMQFSNKKQDAIDAFYLLADDLLVNPFSIGFTYKDFDGLVYKGVEVQEVSLTAFPSNPRARVLEVMSKSTNEELKTAVIEAYKSVDVEPGEEIKEEVKDDTTETKEVTGKSDSTEEQETSEETSKESIDTEAESDDEAKEDDTEQIDNNKEKNIMTEDQVQEKIEAAVKAASEEATTKAVEAMEAKAQADASAQKEAEKEAQKETAAITVMKDNKELFTVKSMQAVKNGNRELLGKMNEDAGKAFGLTEKAVHDYTDLGQAILCEELDRDITRCIDTAEGTIGSYVGKYILTQSNKYSYVTLDGELNYTFIDDCEDKPSGGQLTATKNSKEPREAAMQLAVCDNLADDLAFDIYNTIRDEAARAENRLIGQVVFTYDGGGTPALATGILTTPGVPTLTATAVDRKQVLRSAVMSLCAGARAGAIWAMNEQTWYDCVLPLLDCDQSCSRELGQSGNFGNFIMTLWDRPIIIDNTIPAGTIVFGDFANYYKYVTKGARAIDFSDTAKSDVLNVNAWDKDMTLVRSHLRATGVVKQNDAFVVITCA